MFDRRPSLNKMEASTVGQSLSPLKTQRGPSDTDYSPTISRYGRSHKPKIQDDYVSTDKKVSAYLKLSPGNQMQYFSTMKEPKKKHSPKKMSPEGGVRRGRPPKPKTPITDQNNSVDSLVSPIKLEPQDPLLPVNGCEWMVGDLAWGRVGGHPFWPCIIALDPMQKIFTKIVLRGRNTVVGQRWMHVQFFGDNGRRSWLNSSAIMTFSGRDAFLQLSETVLAGMRKKDPKQTSAFVIKPAVVQVWEKAVQEAEDLANATREERIAFFAANFPYVITEQLPKEEVTGPILEEDPLASPPPKKRGRKRKADSSSQEDLLKSKQIKLEKEDVKEDVNESAEPMETDVTVKVEKEVTQPMKTEVKEEVSEDRHSLLSSTPRTIADRKKRQALLMQMARSNRMAAADAACDVTPASAPATPATPNHRPSFAESTPIEKKKPKKKYSKRVAPIVNNDFQNFCSRNFDKVSDEHPDLNEKEINKHLQNLWNNMDDTAKSRFRARKGVVTQEQEDSDSLEETSEELEEDNDADVQSSKSSNEAEPQSSVSSSPAAEASVKPVPAKRTLKKLFTGIKFEKVCQICEKAGDTVRCRGPCQGFYHPNCTTNPPPAPLDTPVPTPRKGRFGRTPRRKSIVENGTPVKEEKEENSVVETDTPVKIKEEIKTEEVAVEVVEPENKGSAKARKGSKDGEEEEGFRCKECSQGRSQPCFICHSYVQEKTGEAKLYRCITSNCGKVYHEECLKAWPQTSWRGNDRGLLTSCPQHTCHTCASDNPAVIKARYNHDKLVRCIRCPTSYHHGNYCLPAGSEILTNSQIICPRHYKPPKKGLITHINAAWCFICASGGELICCDLCPTAFHADCLQLSDPPDTYVCEDCQTGRFPLYGEIVWVKLGRYRWWPAKILYPSQIPDNILNLPHVRGEFAVRFFGSHDHYWVNRGRVFLYQDGDTAGKTKYKKASVDHTFEKAVIEASEAQRKYLLDKASRDAETRPGMKPPHYVKLKTNKPVGSVRPLEMNLSNLTPCECDPTKDNPCAPDSDCLNRILMVECNPQVCPAGEKCCNQLFEKRQYPPLQPYQTLERGWGLKTLVPLKKGDFVIEYVGEMIDEEEYKRRLADMHERNDDNFYFLTIDKDRMLDAGPKGNVARFMNHSCQPNCETQKWTVNGDTRVGLFALYDIPANTELVFNYNLESTGNEKKPCMCGAPNCSGFIGVKAIKQEKEDKEKKPVKKKRVAKPSEVKCFMCCKEGDLLRCDGKKCTKVYHLSCLGKKQAPQGYWLCPWHQCNVCHKGRVRRCHLCVNSYCQEHAEGNIREDPDSKHLICTKHDQDQAVGIQDAKGSSLLMEVDGNSSDNSTTTSSLSSDPPVKEVTNNNVVKDVGTPRLRTRRSKSFADIVVNGSVEKVNTRRKRPSSVDEVLIQETTELKNKRSYKPLDEIDTKSIAREIIDEVIDKFPVETKYSLKINENCEETKENILSLNKDFDIEEKKSPEELNDNGGNENTEENKTEIINASYEVENPNDTSETDTDKLSGKDLTSTKASENVDSLKYYKSCPLELSKEDESIAKNVEPKNNIDYHEIVESDEITNEDMLVENRTENEFAESKPFKDIPNGESQNPTNNVDNDMKHISVSESSEKENLVQNGIVDKNSEDESSLNQSEEEACKSEPMEVKTIGASPNSGRMIDTDENLDDFELSYSENSTDKLFKSVNNSESSIEMKVTNCGTTEEDTIARKLEELHGTSDMVNGVEQSSVA